MHDESAERGVRLAFRVEGLHCADEVEALRRACAGAPGLSDVQVDLLRCRLSVRCDPAAGGEAAVVAAAVRAGLRARPWTAADEGAGSAPAGQGAHEAHDGHAHHAHDADGTGRVRDRLVLAGALLLPAGLVWHAFAARDVLSALAGRDAPLPSRVLYALAVALTCGPLLPRALAAARGLRPDMHLLMASAIAGALVLGDWLEAATVSVLFAVSLELEAWSVGRARRAVSTLLHLAPPTAEVLDAAGGAARVPVASVAPGARVRVRPGERVPLDGRVASGRSALDESALTGESVPVEKGPGDLVHAGAINGRGALEVTVTHAAGDTLLARIRRLVSEAHAQRGSSERFVERFARVYTPLVMGLALLAALVPPLLLGRPWADSFYDALVLLVIACPCALVISTPVAVVCALASAARQGVLVKGGRFVELPARVRTVAFDKTGTLTPGRPVVVEVVPAPDHTVPELLGLAAAVEAASSHPLAAAVVAHARAQGVPAATASDVRELPGRGVEGHAGGALAWIGSHRLLEERGQETPAQHRQLEALESAGRSVVIVGRDDHVCGWIVLADEPRPAAAHAVAALHAAGVERVVLLTGDNAGTALALGRRLGLDEVRAGLLPADKQAAVTELAQLAGPVAMVGDGVNDAPALAAASVGIALGGAATDVAIETADIVVMSDDLLRVPWLIGHARATLAVIRQNIVAALGIKALVIGLAFAGHATLWAAIAADMGVSLAVVANALRLLRAAPAPAAPPAPPEGPEGLEPPAVSRPAPAAGAA